MQNPHFPKGIPNIGGPGGQVHIPENVARSRRIQQLFAQFTGSLSTAWAEQYAGKISQMSEEEWDSFQSSAFKRIQNTASRMAVLTSKAMEELNKKITSDAVD